MNLRDNQAHISIVLDNKISEIIMNLDIQHSKLDMSLREMILSIKSWDANPSNLFHVVNELWKRDKFFCSVTTSHSASEKIIVDALIPNLQSVYGIKTLDFFNPYAYLKK